MRYQTSKPNNPSRTGILVIVGILVGCFAVLCLGSATALYFYVNSNSAAIVPNTPSIAIKTPPEVRTAVAVPTSLHPWKLYATAIKPIGSSGGFTEYQVTLALENQSDEWLTPPSSQVSGIVETREGFTYDVRDANSLFSENHYPYWQVMQLPPKFRVTGASSDFSVSIRVAETSHLLKLKLTGFDDVDLTSPQAITLPTDKPATSFRNPGESVQIPDKARLALTRAVVENIGTGYLNMVVEIEFQNLNKGYETVMNSNCFVIDGMGEMHRTPFGYTVGPGQTIRKQSGFNFLANQSNRIVPNAKFVCVGEFQVIWNIVIPK